MIISGSRKEYFENPQVSEILRTVIPKDDSKPITRWDVERFDKEHPGRIVIGTREGSLEGVIAKDYHKDTPKLIETVDALEDDQLLFITEDYRIEKGDVRHVLAYSSDSVINLDSAAVNKALFGESRSGRAADWRFNDRKVTPEDRLVAALEIEHDNWADHIDDWTSCIAYRGKDGVQRIFSVIRCIEGYELRAFNDLAFMQLGLPKLREMLRTGKDEKGRKMGKTELNEIGRRVARYNRYIAHTQRALDIQSLDLVSNDLIEPDGNPFSEHTCIDMKVLSRSSRIGNPYDVEIADLPLKRKGQDYDYSSPLALWAHCHCADQRKNSRRRKSKFVKDEHARYNSIFHCAHSIAALHRVRRIYAGNANKYGVSIPHMPVPIPHRGLHQFVEKLRHQTVMLTYNRETDRWSKRRLNKTEMENLACARMRYRGPEVNLTTDPRKVISGGYDPNLDLIKFRR